MKGISDVRKWRTFTHFWSCFKPVGETGLKQAGKGTKRSIFFEQENEKTSEIDTVKGPGCNGNVLLHEYFETKIRKKQNKLVSKSNAHEGRGRWMFQIL